MMLCEVEVAESARSKAMEERPDPFEDIPAPPLRLTPRIRRAAAEPSPAADPAPGGEASAPVPPPALAVVASPAAPARIEALPHDRRRGGARREIALALLVGVAIAAVIVAGAVYLRPQPVALGSGPVPAAETAATPVANVTIRLRLPSNLSAARTDAVRRAAAGVGFARIEVLTVSEPIAETRVEYFHPQDRTAAETLAAALAQFAGGPLSARTPEKEEAGVPVGRIDLWVSGS